MYKDYFEKIKTKIKEKLDTLSERELFMYKTVTVSVLVLIIAGMIFSSLQAQKTPVSQEVDIQTEQIGDADMMAPVEVDVEDDEMEKMVSMTMKEAGRADPFLPPTDAISGNSAYVSFDLITPPQGFDTDSDAVKVVETKVSGIMYDNYSPSAILNIEGADYLVRSGDTINNYKVLAISPVAVTVQLGANVYKAGVGELLTSGEVKYNNVPNINSRFGGNRSRTY